MYIAQNIQQPRIFTPRIQRPYVSRRNYSTPRVYQPRIVAPITASFIVGLPVSISPGTKSGCFDATATNTTPDTVTLHKIIGVSPSGQPVTTVPQGNILPGQTGRFTFCNLATLTSVQFTANRSF